MSATELIVVRHGQSQANHLNIIQGQTSTPLSELGLKQAAALGKALSSYSFDAVYSSDLERAMQTAALAAPGHTIIPNKELREWNLGIFQGLTYPQAAAQYPNEWMAFRNSQSDCLIPGGESAHDIRQRVVTFLDTLLQRHDHGRLLLVTHGGVIRCILKHAMGIKGEWPVSPSTTNASFSQFTVQDGRWRLDCWNCTRHLTQLLEATGVF